MSNQTGERLAMPVGEAIFTQRAIRRLKTDPISDEDLELLLTAAARAPSGGNFQPWRMGEERRGEERRRGERKRTTDFSGSRLRLDVRVE